MGLGLGETVVMIAAPILGLALIAAVLYLVIRAAVAGGVADALARDWRSRTDDHGSVEHPVEPLRREGTGATLDT